jgi:hypothetical protein
MNSVENYYKLQCARLDEQRKVLLKQLRQLEEEITNIPAAPTAPQDQQTMKSSVVNGKRKTKSKMIGNEDQDDQEPQPQQPTPFHGLAATPQEGIVRKGLLANYFDNPRTSNFETADQESWQNVNQSVGNYMTNQVQQMMRKQGMV